MHRERNCAILTAYSTLATVALGVLSIDVHLRLDRLPDFPAQAPNGASAVAPALSAEIIKPEWQQRQQTASASTARPFTL